MPRNGKCRAVTSGSCLRAGEADGEPERITIQATSRQVAAEVVLWTVTVEHNEPAQLARGSRRPLSTGGKQKSAGVVNLPSAQPLLASSTLPVGRKSKHSNR